MISRTRFCSTCRVDNVTFFVFRTVMILQQRHNTTATFPMLCMLQCPVVRLECIIYTQKLTGSQFNLSRDWLGIYEMKNEMQSVQRLHSTSSDQRRDNPSGMARGLHSFPCHPHIYPRIKWVILHSLREHSPDGVARARWRTSGSA